MSDRVPLDLDIVNDTTANIPIQFTVDRSEDLIDNSDRDWSVGISRFYIPTDLLKPYNIEASNSITNDYQIGVYFNELAGNLGANQIEQVSASSSSITDLMNSCNRTLLTSYYDLIKASGPNLDPGVIGNNQVRKYYKSVMTHEFSWDYTDTGSARKQHVVANLVDDPGFDCIGLKLHITNLYISQGVELDHLYTDGLEINIITPSGKRCNVLTGWKLDRNTLGAIIPPDISWTFADWLQKPFNIRDTSGEYYPTELFSKLYAEEAAGSWLIEVGHNYDIPDVSANEFKIQLNADFEIIYRRKESGVNYHSVIPRVAPYLSLTSGNVGEMYYSEKAAITGLKVVMSKALNAIFKFPASDLVISGTTYDAVSFPPVAAKGSVPSEDNLLTVTTASASSGGVLASDVYKLIFKSTLPIRSTIIGNTQRASDNILTDYVLEQYDNQFYTFAWSYPNRLFPLISSSNTNSFQVSVYVERLNGSQELMSIMPGKRANISLDFYKGRSL